MVTLRRIEPSARGYAGRASSFHMRAGSADDTPSLDVVAAGMRSVVEALNSGTLSEERAVDLINVLLAAYAGESISLHIGHYLESGLSSLLEYQAQEWEPVGRQN